MLKVIQLAELPQLLTRIAADHQLLTPRKLPDGTRLLLPWRGEELALSGEPLQRKPTAYFFPQTELLLTLDQAGSIEPPPRADKRLALFGLGREDLAGIAFLDRFFAAEPIDLPYLRRRQNALLVGLAGDVGPKGDWRAPAGENCDFELILHRSNCLAQAYTPAGERWLNPYPLAATGRLDQLSAQDSAVDRRSEQLHRAGELLERGLVPEEFWAEIARRCILCCGCNLACPTCNCFCIQDRQTPAGVERSRVWDSCQLDAFMREASGHNPLGTEALRTRRRITHKLVNDRQRWGELGCVGCGRCDRACPTGIGIFAVTEELLRRFEANSG